MTSHQSEKPTIKDSLIVQSEKPPCDWCGKPLQRGFILLSGVEFFPPDERGDPAETWYACSKTCLRGVVGRAGRK